jgi:hypothetical protein
MLVLLHHYLARPQRVGNSLGLPGATADLRNQEVHTERCVLVVEEALEFCDLFPEHVWGVADATDHTDATGVGDGCCELGTGGNVHAGEHDGVCDLEQVGGDRADLFWLGVSMLRSHCLRFLERGRHTRGSHDCGVRVRDV